jgi:hypothetical protein
MNCLISIQITKGKNSWYLIGNILLNHVNIFILTDYLSTKLDIISVANSAYRATELIIPSSFLITDNYLKVNLILRHRAGIMQSVLYASRLENVYWI